MSKIYRSQLISHNVNHVPESKIIYEEALTGKTMTYGGFRQQIRLSACWLRREFGLKPGQVVSVVSPSCIDYLVAMHAVWWTGAIANPINNSLHFREIGHALDLAETDVLILHDSLLETVDSILASCHRADKLKFPTQIVSTPNKENEDLTPYPLPGGDSRKVQCAILLSSGTTGRPKAVVTSHYNMVAACLQLRGDNEDNWRESQREIFFPPLSHIYGVYVCATLTSWVGGYICLMPRFDLETFCRLMQDRQATLARLVPPIAKQLAENAIVKKFKYPHLEYFSCSAAPLDAKLTADLQAAFPGVRICQTYGCTELSGPCNQSGVRNRNMPLGAVGTFITNTEVRFISEAGEETGPHGPGEIVVRGPNVVMGYKNNPQANAETFLEGGWLRTGDIGYVDNAGFLYIQDRLKDVIKYNGFQVSPAEIEELLVQHPQVLEVAIIGIYDEALSTDLPRACVALRSQTNDQDKARVARELAAMVSKELSHYKQLRGGVIFLDELPKNPTGKVLRRELRDLKSVRVFGQQVRSKL